MKNKVFLTIGVSLLTLAVFSGGMALARDKGTFYLEDIEGERQYLNLFPMEGLAGDSTHSIRFQLADGELTRKDYPISVDELGYIFDAERAGKEGDEKYSMENRQNGMDGNFHSYSEAAPKAGAKIERSNDFDEARMNDAGRYFMNREEYTKAETVTTDAVDIYLEMECWNTSGYAYIKTGISIEGEEFIFSKVSDETGNSSSRWATYEENRLPLFVVEEGDTAYAIVGTDSRCQGTTSLFRFTYEEMLNHERDDEEYWAEYDKIYREKEFGEGEILATFPVDKEHRMLGMAKAGEGLFILRTEGNAVLAEMYDTDGNLLKQDICSQDAGLSVDTAEFETTSWKDGSASIKFEIYRKILDEGNSTEDYNHYALERLDSGVYQIDEEGMKRLQSIKTDGDLMMCLGKSNLVLNVSYEEVAQKRIPQELDVWWSDELHFTIINGETGKLLYRGRLVTDFMDDKPKRLSDYYLQGRKISEPVSNSYPVDGMTVKRVRRVTEIQPLDGRRENVWWR